MVWGITSSAHVCLADLRYNPAQSVLSDTSTLCGDSAAAKQDQSAATKKAVKLSDSAEAFDKKAREEGWGAPTATRPSLGA